MTNYSLNGVKFYSTLKYTIKRDLMILSKNNFSHLYLMFIKVNLGT